MGGGILVEKDDPDEDSAVRSILSLSAPGKPHSAVENVIRRPTMSPDASLDTATLFKSNGDLSRALAKQASYLCLAQC